MKQKFIDYYMDVAERTSKLSSAIRRQVGAVIVKENRILSYGYNGMPTSWTNECEYKAKLDEKYGENYDLGIGDSFIVKYKPEGECRPRGYEDLEIGDKITLTKKWSNIQDIIFGTDWPSANIPGKDYIDGLSTDQISLLRGLGSCDPIELIASQRNQDNDPNLWNVFNRIQEKGVFPTNPICKENFNNFQ